MALLIQLLSVSLANIFTQPYFVITSNIIFWKVVNQFVSILKHLFLSLCLKLSNWGCIGRHSLKIFVDDVDEQHVLIHERLDNQSFL
jgi:hypothetical protein